MSEQLERLKREFEEKVNESHICYDWDAGWCYSYIKHPLLNQADAALSDEDWEAWEQYTNDWLYQNDGPLYHMSDVVGKKLVNQVGEFEGSDAKEYAEGLLSYLKLNPCEFYSKKVLELEVFINSP